MGATLFAYPRSREKGELKRGRIWLCLKPVGSTIFIPLYIHNKLLYKEVNPK
jgi:hypothetical protein